ncbi:phage/plasmid primase, P4 family [Polaromonas sp. JS666]|uniref:phage/plasmid primase, P4 family n=1 Tax=Polaromonas sp. (strain JS666 / ATCC BAA-500) TaxID=296591 RepID=UPI0000533A27|nr:phage/plasmid primase, P4 family [Polaromonas sp. JS666]ABE43265.1 Phage/plasmid primase P4-like protein [Polaromonas sp. JS666]
MNETNCENDSAVAPAAQMAARDDLIAAYLAAGFALVPIPHGLKGPRAAGWNLRENAITTSEQAQAQLNGSCNIGLAHAYSNPPTCALDIDNMSLARPWFAERGIDLDALLNAPGAVRIHSGRPGRAKLLYRLPQPLPSCTLPWGELRCASGNGTTWQDVLPPSTHPDTGRPYAWIGDIANIQPIPDAPLSAWRQQLAAKGRKEPHAVPCAQRDDLPPRFAELLHADPKLRTRWDGETGGLNDASRSGLDMSLASLMVMRGFNDHEIATALRAFAHGKAAQDGRGDHDYTGPLLAKLRAQRTLSRSEPAWTAHRLVAEKFTAEDGAALLLHWRGDFYGWRAGAWRSMAPADLEAVIYAYLGGAQYLGKNGAEPFGPNRARVGDVMAALRATAHLASHHAPPCWLNEREGDPDARDLLVMANGIMHLPSRTLRPHDAQLFTTTGLPFAYDANAEPPMAWLRFLRELWPDDAESRETLQEFFGYLLTADSSRQKILMVVGPKRAGKGTAIKVMRALLGEANCVGPTLDSLRTNFGLQPLIEKRLAVISDARLSGRVDQQALAERLLAVSGEDTLTVDRKHISAWTGRLGVRFVLLTNELPRIADSSGALASRFIVLRLTRSWLGSEDLGLADRLLRELPAILNWSLNGLERLCQRGQFRQPAAASELVRELEDLGSPVGAFLRESCVVTPGAEVERGRLFQAWRLWCQAHGWEHHGTEATFGRDLRAALPDLQTHHPRVEGRQRRFYRGVGLADSWQGNGEMGFFNRLRPAAGG